MAKRDQRWPVWKIVLVLVAFVVGAAALLIGGAYLSTKVPTPNKDTPPDPDIFAKSAMANMLQLFGALSGAMALVCVGWLVVRYYQSIPAWKKRAKLPPHRRK